MEMLTQEHKTLLMPFPKRPMKYYLRNGLVNSKSNFKDDKRFNELIDRRLEECKGSNTYKSLTKKKHVSM